MRVGHFSGRGGIRLAADVGGSPGARTVILTHGGGQTRHSWGRAFRDLVAAGYQVISLDARGHGEGDDHASLIAGLGKPERPITAAFEAFLSDTAHNE